MDLIRRSWVRFPPRSKDFFFASCGSLFPFTRANAQWVIHGFKVALKFTLQSWFSGSTICVPSATRHNIHLYPYFLFAAIHHPKSSPTFSVRPCSSVVAVDLIRRSWVRFPPRSKDFFFASCGSLFPFTRANAQWVIHGFKVALKFTLQSWFSGSTICVPSATRHNIHLYPYFLFAAIHHPKSSPTFSVRPCSSVGGVAVDLIRRSWVRFPPRSKDFFFASCGSLFPFTRANAQWVIHGFKVALKFTLQSWFSGSTICVPSATRHNIHLYPYFLFAAIHHPKSSPTFSVRPCSSVGGVAVDLIRRSWVRFPPRSKDFFFASCGSLFPFTRANAQWVIHGFKVALKFTLQSWFSGSTICVPSATRHNIHLYPYFLFAAIHHPKSSPTFSVRPCSSVGGVAVDLIRRSWVRFPPRSKDFFFASCGSLFPFTRANAQWVIHGFKVALKFTLQSWFSGSTI